MTRFTSSNGKQATGSEETPRSVAGGLRGFSRLDMPAKVVVVVCAKDRPQPECLLPKDLTGFVSRKAVMACVWGPSCPMNVMKWSEGRPSSLDRPLPPFPHKFRRTSVKLRPASVADDWKRFHADLGQVRRPPPHSQNTCSPASTGGRTLATEWS